MKKNSGLFTRDGEIVFDVHCCSGTLENWRGNSALQTEKLSVDRVFVCKTKPVQ